MGRYTVVVEKNARKQLAQLYKSGDKTDIKKIEKIFLELSEHPTTGTGRPEQLKYELAGLWSRRINQRDRLIYKIDEKEIIIVVLSAQGHYFDK